MIHSVGNIPILTIDWPEFNNHKDDIVNVCLSNEKENTIDSGIAVNLKNNIWESDLNFLDKLPALNKWFIDTTQDFLREINNKEFKVHIMESWAHVTRENGWHGPHRHQYHTWSGIFHVSADRPENGANTFFNHFSMPIQPEYSFFSEDFDIKFKPGQLILFPSTMMHYAKPYVGKERIVIAYNVLTEWRK